MIKVGAATETEMKEKKARVEDALHATRAATEEGIVPGGGVALLRALPTLAAFRKTVEDLDERQGVDIIVRAIELPMATIGDEPGLEGSSSSAGARNSRDRVSTPARVSSSTWSRPASSTRPK